MNYTNGYATKAAINLAVAEQREATERYTLREFYPGHCSGLVDDTQHTLESLDLDGRCGASGRAMAGRYEQVFYLEVGECTTLSTSTKGYTFRVTRVA